MSENSTDLTNIPCELPEKYEALLDAASIGVIRKAFDYPALTLSLDNTQSNRFLACALVVIEEKPSTLSPEEIGNRFDATIVTLRATASALHLDVKETLLLYDVVSRVISKNSFPGLDQVVRSELLLQIMQIVNSNYYGIRMVDDRTKGTRYKPLCRQVPLIEGLLDKIDDKTSPQETFTICAALSCPYSQTFGSSETGINNLTAFNHYLESAAIRCNGLGRDELKMEGMWMLARQAYHTYGGALPSSLMTQLPFDMREQLAKYRIYRDKHPLWSDRLQIFRQAHRAEESEAYPVGNAGEMRVGISIPGDNLIKFLDTKKWYTLHDIDDPDDLPGKVTDATKRSHAESQYLMLAQGTPDDPYVVYTGARIMRRTHFNSLNYGAYTIILKPEVLFRTSVTAFDSLGSPENGNDSYPYYGTSWMSHFEHRAYGRWKQKHDDYDRTDYVEGQVFGGISLEDIECVVYNEEWEVPERIDKVREASAHAGIKFIGTKELSK